MAVGVGWEMEARTEALRGALEGLLKTGIFTAISAVALFASAGWPYWPWGWGYVGLSVLSLAVYALAVHPDLQAERAGVGEGVERWDIPLAILMARVLPLAVLIVAGLDVRARGTAQVSSRLHVAALAVALLSVALVTWAIRANDFFSGLVRIQQDRGHVVVSGGPYRWLRHPGYAGTILFDVATPLVLGSLWALVPAAFLAGVIVVRTALEDRKLRRDLEGYEEYTRQVRHRLVPWVW
jgi:protein-S-isoprenylcysteine O-methyltransferase Ste14